MQSVTDFAQAHGITVADWETHGFHADADGWEHQRWTFHLSGPDGQTLDAPYRTGMAIEEIPTVADILDSLATDADCGGRDFEDFCADFGLDTDSRRAFATWEACRDMRAKLTDFMGPDALEELIYATERL